MIKNEMTERRSESERELHSVATFSHTLCIALILFITLPFRCILVLWYGLSWYLRFLVPLSLSFSSRSNCVSKWVRFKSMYQIERIHSWFILHKSAFCCADFSMSDMKLAQLTWVRRFTEYMDLIHRLSWSCPCHHPSIRNQCAREYRREKKRNRREERKKASTPCTHPHTNPTKRDREREKSTGYGKPSFRETEWTEKKKSKQGKKLYSLTLSHSCAHKCM